jgi:hypothetical protein
MPVHDARSHRGIDILRDYLKTELRFACSSRNLGMFEIRWQEDGSM